MAKKEYNLGGVGANVELGKQGPQVQGGTAGKVKLDDGTGNAIVTFVGVGTNPTHAVQKSQLDAVQGQSYQKISASVNFNSGTVAIGIAKANLYVHRVVIESDAAWTNHNSATNITVGDTGDNTRLFGEFDPECQTADETDYKYPAQTTINAYVTPGGATAGSADITLWYSGNFVD